MTFVQSKKKKKPLSFYDMLKYQIAQSDSLGLGKKKKTE